MLVLVLERSRSRKGGLEAEGARVPVAVLGNATTPLSHASAVETPQGGCTLEDRLRFLEDEHEQDLFAARAAAAVLAADLPLAAGGTAVAGAIA
jgi:hypothetical protein